MPAAWQRPSINAASRLGAQLMEMAVVVAALFSGNGVVSLGWGSLAGGMLGLLLTLGAISRHWRLRQLPTLRPDRASLRWLFSVGVSTLLSRVVSQIAGNLELALVSTTLGPSMAAVYGITVRTFALVQGFINPIAGSAFSGLAHLMGQRGPSALLPPLRELRGLFTLVVSVVVPAILVINQDFVSLWVGPDKFGGRYLCAALALSTVPVTQVSFLSFVSAASGRLRSAAYLTVLEAVVRVPLMIAGLHILGPAGIAISTSLECGLLVYYAYPALIGRGLGLARAAARTIGNDGLGAILGCVLAGGLAARYLPAATHWPTLVVKGALTALVLLGLTVLTNRGARSQLRVVGVRVFRRVQRFS